jgi:hypothetical protein
MRSLIKPLSAVALVAALLLAVTAEAGAQTGGGSGYQFDAVRNACSEPGETNSIHGNFFAPGSTVSVVLQGTTIGTLAAGANGVVDGTFTVPSNAPTGQVTIQLVGQNQSGAPRTLSFTLQIGGCTAPGAGGGGAAAGGGGQAAGRGAGQAAGGGAGGGALAFTGGSVGLLVGIGAAAMVLGGAAVVGARRRRVLGTPPD